MCVCQTTMCLASGPGEDMFESTRIIGHNVYLKAKVRVPRFRKQHSVT